tara:strand:- start:86 stop:631 length:546 start_codon:yes stop_codon:yes gene_type:complete
MINSILFRGGMYGDLLLGMIDPTALIKTKNFKLEYKHARCADRYIKYTRTFMKKYFRYTDAQKKKYYDRFDKHDVWTSTHDTDYSYKQYKNTIQIICSDIDLHYDFAKRFFSVNENQSGSVDEYAETLKGWQLMHNFPKRFDIKNIHNKTKFIMDIKNFFNVTDTMHMENIYDKHFQMRDQ